MKTRLIAGLSAAAILIALIFFVPLKWVTLVVVAFAAWAYMEYDRLLFEIQKHRRQIRLIVLITFSLMVLRHAPGSFEIAVAISFVLLGVANVIHWDREPSLDRALLMIGLQWLGYFYVVCLFGFVLPILSISPYLFLLLCLQVFTGDSMAYFVGVAFGKHKLAPNISPKKSIEGAIAAIVSCTLISWVWYQYSPYTHGPLSQLLIFAPIVSLLAQFGDLFESLLKRCRSTKDSGSFLPGHGGLLDRVDGLAFSSPIFYYFVTEVWGRI